MSCDMSWEEAGGGKGQRGNQCKERLQPACAREYRWVKSPQKTSQSKLGCGDWLAFFSPQSKKLLHFNPACKHLKIINVSISIFDFCMWLDRLWNSTMSWLQHEHSGNEWKKRTESKIMWCWWNKWECWFGQIENKVLLNQNPKGKSGVYS